jgi:hypothetical protein
MHSKQIVIVIFRAELQEMSVCVYVVKLPAQLRIFKPGQLVHFYDGLQYNIARNGGHFAEIHHLYSRRQNYNTQQINVCTHLYTMSIIENLRSEVAALEETARSLDEQRAATGEQLLRKRKLLAAFDIVSTDPATYDLWVASVMQTPRPVTE